MIPFDISRLQTPYQRRQAWLATLTAAWQKCCELDRKPEMYGRSVEAWRAYNKLARMDPANKEKQ